jgi:hypothetical protein
LGWRFIDRLVGLAGTAVIERELHKSHDAYDARLRREHRSVSAI